MSSDFEVDYFHRVEVNYSDYINCMHMSHVILSGVQSLQKMPALTFAQVLKSYFLFSTVGFAFICDEGEQAISFSVLDEVLCVCHAI